MVMISLNADFSVILSISANIFSLNGISKTDDNCSLINCRFALTSVHSGFLKSCVRTFSKISSSDLILFKYPTLTKTLVDLLTKDFKDYITGVYIIAPIPTTFKVVLHNNQFFYLTYMGRSWIAKISGKKYYLLNLGEEERARVAIANLLMLGKAKEDIQGPESPTSPDTETPPQETTPEETA